MGGPHDPLLGLEDGYVLLAGEVEDLFVRVVFEAVENDCPHVVNEAGKVEAIPPPRLNWAQTILAITPVATEWRQKRLRSGFSRLGGP